MLLTYWKKLCLCCFFIQCTVQVFSQHADSSIQRILNDTLQPDFVSDLQKKGNEITDRNIKKYKAGRLAIRQQYLIEEIRGTTQKAKIYLKKGIDRNRSYRQLEETRASFNIANEGVFQNTGTIQTQRNLAASSAVLTELLRQLVDQKNELEDYNNDLIAFRDKIDSLSSDPALYTSPSDSLAALKYIQKVSIVAKEIGPTDSVMNQALSYTRDLQTDVEVLIYSIRSSLEDVNNYRNNLTNRAFSRELSNITGPIENSRPLKEIIEYSLAKEKLALNFYVKENRGRLVILISLIIATSIFIRSLKSKMVHEKTLDPGYKGQLTLRYPILTSIVVILSIFQFIFLDPPYIFSFFLWLISAICLTIIMKIFIARYWMRFWIIMILFFGLASMNNMILQVSRTERWLLWVLALTGATYCSYYLLRGKKDQLRERKLPYFIAFVVISEVASLLLNTFGRYNVSKTLLISGYSGLVIAVLFLWTIRLINEILGLISKVYKHPDAKLFYINFEKIGDKAPGFFYVFLVLGWIILVGRNFYSFNQFAADFNDFLTTERNLGNYTFTINGLFVFFLILTCSVILSKIISFFAEPGESHSKDKKPGKVGLGSWLLLIRIIIISLGLFLAFAASGIPLDKITIIIGALGVGIGLGLQGLVNNLVSGLIIAFEKPVNVGDIIEVNNKPGVMKSIGFRSSVVTLADGACLIIPNGDLLSQHLINWSIGRNNKRLTINVSVAYGSDLEKVHQILNGILENEERIRSYPSTVIAAKQFSSGSIDFELQFWINIMSDGTRLKGDIIEKINAEFNKAGIVIPIPQQELYIRSVSKKPAQADDGSVSPASANN